MRNFFQAIIAVLLAGLWAFARPARAEALDIIPTPQQYEAREGRLVLASAGAAQAGILLSEQPDRKEELAAEYIAAEIKRLAGVEIPVIRGGPGAPGAACIRLGAAAGKLATADVAFLNSERTGQGYILAASADAGDARIDIVGAAPQGTLYGAMTLLQMLRMDGTTLVVDAAYIRDYPDFPVRVAASAYVSSPGRLDAARLEVDFALRHKINSVNTSLGAGAYIGNAASVRAINAYARERGIRGLASLKMGQITSTNLGEKLLNRRSYPDGEVYQCIYENEPLTDLYCPSNDEKIALEVRHLAEAVRLLEPGLIQVHHVMDNDRWVMGVKMWSRRCAACRARWPDDDPASLGGLAGAEAHYWNQAVEAIQGVRNEDSGYDAGRDLIVYLVPSIYGNYAEDDASFDQERAFYAAIAGALTRSQNVYLSTREQGLRRDDGRKRFMQMAETLRPTGVGLMGWIWSGGREERGSPQSYNHFFWFSPLPAIMQVYEGAEVIFVAANDSPMQTLLGAEYTWNSRAPGAYNPETQEQYVQAFAALGKSRETPPAVYGPGGFIDRACRNMVGVEAGAYLARGFKSRQTIGGQAITPMFSWQSRITTNAWDKSIRDGSALQPEILEEWKELWWAYAQAGQEADACFRAAMKQDGFARALPYVQQQVKALAGELRTWSGRASEYALDAILLAAVARPAGAAEAPDLPAAPRKSKGSVIEVGVFANPDYYSLGMQAGAPLLRDAPGLNLRTLDKLTPGALAECDVLILHASKRLPDDWRAALVRFVTEGHGLLLLHNAVGYRGFGPSLFPEIVVRGLETPRVNRVKAVGRHPATDGLADGDEFTHSYYDHVLMQPGARGVTVLGEAGTEIGHGVNPALVVGEWGHGRTAFSGIVFGYREAGAPPADPEEQKVLLNLMRWLAEPRFK